MMLPGDAESRLYPDVESVVVCHAAPTRLYVGPAEALPTWRTEHESLDSEIVTIKSEYFTVLVNDGDDGDDDGPSFVQWAVEWVWLVG